VIDGLRSSSGPPARRHGCRAAGLNERFFHAQVRSRRSDSGLRNRRWSRRRLGARGLGSVAHDDAMTAAAGHVEALETWSPERSSFSPGRRLLRPSQSRRRGAEEGDTAPKRGGPATDLPSHIEPERPEETAPAAVRCNRSSSKVLPHRVSPAEGGVLCRPFMPGPRCGSGRRGVRTPVEEREGGPRPAPRGRSRPRMSVSPRGPVCHEKAARFVMKKLVSDRDPI
jgi:hypothetical protein